MTPALHKTAYNRAKTARVGEFAQLAGGGAPNSEPFPKSETRCMLLLS